MHHGEHRSLQLDYGAFESGQSPNRGAKTMVAGHVSHVLVGMHASPG